ncbi:hypothetical protein CUJ83_09770 [Methanocella sp. CWC-04]|uniref:Uncharacterized protein n=1 Tax=Methanooceanicella nereidis TaxID=2052831 RepID=A0AAP2W7Q3_9EURY|nr:hypothetical protein [Methanocella sp. CWC-04]MCD1295286.1 hypothetical protein [Methanocella sp. CWC-04]
MFDLFSRSKNSDKREPVNGGVADTQLIETEDSFSLYEGTDFKRKVYALRSAIIEAINKLDKRMSIDNAKNLSDLTAKAIYYKDLRAITLIDVVLSEIKKVMDDKMASLKEPEDPFEDMEMTGNYMRSCMALVPVNSMLCTIKEILKSAIQEADNDISHRVNDIQRFVKDYENSVS